MTDDKKLLEYYRLGFKDELRGSSSIVPQDFYITRAYQIGANHAELGDDNRSFDALTDEQILMIIKVLR